MYVVRVCWSSDEKKNWSETEYSENGIPICWKKKFNLCRTTNAVRQHSGQILNISTSEGDSYAECVVRFTMILPSFATHSSEHSSDAHQHKFNLDFRMKRPPSHHGVFNSRCWDIFSFASKLQIFTFLSGWLLLLLPSSLSNVSHPAIAFDRRFFNQKFSFVFQLSSLALWNACRDE